MTNASSFRYKAFISYSHRDTEFADVLHRYLEAVKVPKQFIGTEGLIGTIQKSLFPIFRDREELPTATDLGAVISDALQSSATLIVLCSPRSAASLWVNQEVENYQNMHADQRIIGILIDGNETDVPPAFDRQSMPLIDARKQRPRALQQVLSKLLDKPFEQIQSALAAQQRRKRLGLASAASIVIATAAGLFWVAQQQQTAQRVTEQRAQIQQAIAQMRTATEQADYHQVQALAEAIQTQTPAAVWLPQQQLALRALQHNAALNARETRRLDYDGNDFDDLAWSADGQQLFAYSGYEDTGTLWQITPGQTEQWQSIQASPLPDLQGWYQAPQEQLQANARHLIITYDEIGLQTTLKTWDREWSERSAVYHPQRQQVAYLEANDVWVIDAKPQWQNLQLVTPYEQPYNNDTFINASKVTVDGQWQLQDHWDKPVQVAPTSAPEDLISLPNTKGFSIRNPVVSDLVLLGNESTELWRMAGPSLVARVPVAISSIDQAIWHASRRWLQLTSYDNDTYLIDVTQNRVSGPLSCSGETPDQIVIAANSGLLITTTDTHLCVALIDTASLSVSNMIYKTKLATNYVNRLQYDSVNNLVRVEYRDGVQVDYPLQWDFTEIPTKDAMQ